MGLSFMMMGQDMEQIKAYLAKKELIRATVSILKPNQFSTL